MVAIDRPIGNCPRMHFYLTRRFTALITIAMLLTAPQVVAQQVSPAGVVAARHFERAKTPALRIGLSVPSDSARGHPWRWVGAGALLGGATSGVAVAVSASRTDDAFFVGPAIGLAAAAGAVVGGLLGGLVYLISH